MEIKVINTSYCQNSLLFILITPYFTLYTFYLQGILKYKYEHS